jgi:hypothetical protein
LFAAVVNSPVSQAVVRFNGVFMPPKFVNKMQYNERWAVTTAGGISSYVYHMNSIYDPYSGVGGDSVYGIDEMAAIYTRYRVIGSTIIVTATCQAVEICDMHVYPCAESGAATMSTADAAPECKYAMLGQYRPVSLQLTSTPAKWKIGANDRDFSAAVTANPAELVYWKILFQNISLNALNLIVNVRIIYDVEWSELKAQSDQDA